MVLNLTALIDVVILLILFFVLVAKFGRYPTLPLTLPRVDERHGELQDPGMKPTVDVVPRGRVVDLGGSYRLGGQTFAETSAGLAGLTSALGEIRREQPDVEVYIRAERTEPYVRVHPVIAAVGAAGVRRVHLTTLPAAPGEAP
jgi:biopolymer transport protein ExbD